MQSAWHAKHDLSTTRFAFVTNATMRSLPLSQRVTTMVRIAFWPRCFPVYFQNLKKTENILTWIGQISKKWVK